MLLREGILSVKLFKDGIFWIKGVANFHSVDGLTICDEIYDHGNSVMSEYSYSFRSSEARLYLYKKDQSLLHEFEFTSKEYPMVSDHNHLCIKDLYCASIVIHSQHEFELSYSVSGPNKNYRLMKQYCSLL